MALKYSITVSLSRIVTDFLSLDAYGFSAPAFWKNHIHLSRRVTLVILSLIPGCLGCRNNANNSAAFTVHNHNNPEPATDAREDKSIFTARFLIKNLNSRVVIENRTSSLEGNSMFPKV